ncbi:hypothetical protein A3A66_00980 [Microgenomates group bacterium RIFCSPLOWO2_01_FULL_46_13]|nr:MAG: hypothetical protein A3A66_00980 [Microgenomates group bacterium RIFCSPLOWO2_01_FULL_46_13]
MRKFFMTWLSRIDIKLLIVLLAGMAVLTRGITKPFIGHHDWNGVQYGAMGRNYLRYGVLLTKLGQVENGGVVASEEFAYNTHYPPTLPLLLAGSFWTLGVSEWSARLVAVGFSILGLWGVYRLAESIIGKNSGWLAALFMLVTPMWRYFGKMPVHEPLITAVAVWVVYGYQRWRSGRLKWRWLFLGVILAQAIGWPGYYLAPLLFTYDWWRYQRPDFHSFLPLALAALGQFGLHLVQTRFLTGSWLGGGLVEIFKFRFNLLTEGQRDIYSLTWAKFLRQEFLWIHVYFTKVQVFLASLGGLGWGLSAVRRSKSGLIGLILVYGVTHAFVFRNAAFIHDYLLFYLAPGIALAATLGWRWLVGKIRLSRYLVTVLSLIVVAVSFLERNNFLVALEGSTMHQIGKEVGEEIAALSKPTDRIVSPTGEFAIIFSKFAAFYADRNISYYNREEGVPMAAVYEFIVKGKEPNGVDLSNFQEKGVIYWRAIQ